MKRLILLGLEYIISKEGICYEEHSRDNEWILQSYSITDIRENKSAYHLPQSHDGNKNSGTSANTFFLKQSWNKHKNQSRQKPISNFVDNPEEKGDEHVIPYHKDMSKTGEEHRK